MIARHLPAHCHPNRPLRSVDGLVIHFISDRYQHPEDPFNLDYIYKVLADYGFSYHALFPRDDEPVETLPPELEAYHAGRSRMNGRDYCNRFTHGAALVGGTGFGYTEDQIIRLAQWTAQDMSLHGYTTDDIQGHDQARAAWNLAHPNKLAAAKHDPGDEFPWAQFFEMLAGVDLANRIKRRRGSREP